MLDATTKRNIDAARDVLVGKVPDPKAQVEQITTALIYKFMDDLDKESLRLGGKAKFFSGEYEKYSWSNLVDTRLSGEARLGLYVQAITSMDKNPSLPQLFRDIFKGAFLPYNDPQTLSLFLKEINKFTYNHSEELGNAFEYLLSIMSSQGAAGQFRTPRHIIDFIVAVVDPKKNETILDPACGTAGFLISSFKHIRKHNSSNFDENNGIGGGLAQTANQIFLQEDPHYRGDLLTQDERRRLMENIQGYDISPDMVRLSLVNLYLHGFPSPNIFEYDTLSSEERWNDTFDVILANPPFMTPKGGIRPHNRFQVQASRSEVLFVDYILEHLNVNGRAGIIVPEGIIFKAENAYKKLRKLLIEDGLYAVVSLPSGVFNPYSGVKTSILFFDKKIAKQVEEILFLKVEYDGFDLGAQRNKIDKNDLPSALYVLRNWRNGEKRENTASLWIRKELLKSNDYNLIGDRYKEVEIHNNSGWPIAEIQNIVKEITASKRIKKTDYQINGNYPIIDQSKMEIAGWSNDQGAIINPEKPVIIFGDHTCAVKYVDFPFIQGADGIKILCPNEQVNPKYLFYILKFRPIESKEYKRYYSILRNTKIPLPPLDVQKEIVEQIEVKQAAIDAAKAVIENLEKERRYFVKDLKKNEEIEWCEIGMLCDLMTGGTPTSTIKEYYEDGKIKWIVSGDIHKNEIFDCDGRITKLGMQNSNAKMLPINSVLIALNGQGKTRGTVAILRTEATCNQSIVSINPKDHEKLIPDFLYFVLQSMYQEIRNITGDKERSGLNMSLIKGIKIPLVPINTQRTLVEKMMKKTEIIQSNNWLIELLESEIAEIIEHV